LPEYPTKRDANIDPKGWLMSEKFDGIRAYWNGKGGMFIARSRVKIHLPEDLANKLPEVPLECEIWCGYNSYEKCQQLLYRHKFSWDEAQILVCYRTISL
jgi:DNA ligase-1